MKIVKCTNPKCGVLRIPTNKEGRLSIPDKCPVCGDKNWIVINLKEM